MGLIDIFSDLKGPVFINEYNVCRIRYYVSDSVECLLWGDHQDYEGEKHSTVIVFDKSHRIKIE